MKKIKYNLIVILVFVISLSALIITIIGVNHLIDNNARFRTSFNLMFGYTKWGRDYAKEIIKEEYENQGITFTYVRADINSEFDDDVIRPYLITLYFLTEEKSVTYLAWTNRDTYTIEWEELQ